VITDSSAARVIGTSAVRVDAATSVPTALVTGGQRYAMSDDDRRREAAEAVPRLTCPNCTVPVTRLDQSAEYVLSSGKVIKQLPACPVGGTGPQPLFYTLKPCGCKTGVEWAGAWSAEMSRRLQGLAPKAPAVLTAKARARRIEDLTALLTRLYQLQKTAVDSTQKEAVDVWVEIVVDNIHRLCPGDHNKKPVATKSDAEWGYSDLYPLYKKAGLVTAATMAAAGATNFTKVLQTINQQLTVHPPASEAALPPGYAARTLNRWGGFPHLDGDEATIWLTARGLTVEDLRDARNVLIADILASAHLRECPGLPADLTDPYRRYVLAAVMDDLRDYVPGEQTFLHRDTTVALTSLIAAGRVTPSQPLAPPAGVKPPVAPVEVAGPVTSPPNPVGDARRARKRRNIRRLGGGG
jgi:hypothetical protein